MNSAKFQHTQNERKYITYKSLLSIYRQHSTWKLLLFAFISDYLDKRKL